jgi:hypothetical protein
MKACEPAMLLYQKRRDTVGEVGSGTVGNLCIVPLARAVGGIRPTSGHMAGFWRRGERP